MEVIIHGVDRHRGRIHGVDRHGGRRYEGE